MLIRYEEYNLCESKKAEDSENVNQILIDFCKNRKEGAEKIARKSKEKGGLAMLTAWHFFAKLPAYNEAISHIKKNDIHGFLEGKFNKLKAKVKLQKVSQKQFQELMGKMEVFGEVACRFHELKGK
jgi:hypothetical protein